MKVLKFGGTSVGSSKNINSVISILENYSNANKVICVVSAVGGITDKLLLAGKQAQNKDTIYHDTFNCLLYHAWKTGGQGQVVLHDAFGQEVS